MDNTNEPSYVDRLRTMLHQIFPEAKDVSSNSQVTINCPLCARDGDPDYKNHMYINLGMNGKPPMFHCFRRTGHSGLLTKRNLEQLSNYSQYIDTSLLTEIEKHSQEILNYRSCQSNTYKILNISVKSQFSRNYDEKIKYISDRIGVNLDYNHMVQNKIVLSIYDFLYYNYIKTFTRDQYTLNILDQHYIGFLTNTNTTLIMRNVMPTYHKLRYVKYNIIDSPPISYYLIPTICDIYKPIDVIIAEGPFDVLSIFYNLYNQDRQNKIYAAIGSKSYLNLIKYIFTVLGLVNVVFHIYIDTGIERSILNDIARFIKPLGIDVWIHINTFQGEKDFGVPLSKISHYYYKL